MIERETHEGVTVFRMRHGKVNAFDLELCRSLAEAVAGVDDGAVVITGHGKTFSAGVDLVRILNDGADYVREFVPAFESMCRELLSYPRPVVAAMNGHAIAGGCVLGCIADRRLMGRGPWRVGIPELLVGVPFPPAAFEAVRLAVPPRWIPEVIYEAAVYDPQEALSRGLIDAVEDAVRLPERALEAARRLGSIPPETFRLTKLQVRGAVLDRLASMPPQRLREVVELWTRPETIGIIRQYVETTFKPS